MNSTQLDPVNVAIAIYAVLFGPALAGVVGPYAIILIGAAVGTFWSLGRRPKGSTFGAIGYFLLMVLTTLLITVNVSGVGAHFLGLHEPTWMLCPTAILVGAVGGDWPKVVAWSVARIAALVDRRMGGGGSS